jgi:hypothetical protein
MFFMNNLCVHHNTYTPLSQGTLNGEPTGFGNMPPGGIQEFAPTAMAAVPKIWDILKKGVEDAIGTIN